MKTKRPYLLVILCFFFCVPARAQSEVHPNKNKLLFKLQHAKHEDTAKVNLLMAISKQFYYKQNYDSSKYYAQTAFQLAQKLNDKKGADIACRYLGDCYSNLNDSANTIKYFNLALSNARSIGDKQDMIHALNLIGYFYSQKNDVDKTISNYQQAISLAKSIPDTIRLMKNYKDLGNAYSVFFNNTKAFEYYNKVLKVSEEAKNYLYKFYALNNLAVLYSTMFDIPKETEYYKKAMIAARKSGYQELIAMTLCNLGSVYTNNKTSKKAENYLNQAVALSLKIKSPRYLGLAYANLAGLYQTQGNLEKAIDYYNRSRISYKKTGLTSGEYAYYSYVGSILFSAPDSILIHLKIPLNKRYQTIIAYEKKASQIAKKEQRPVREAFCLHALTKAYEKVGNYKAANETLDSATSLVLNAANVNKQKAMVRKEMQFKFQEKEAAAKAAHEKEVLKQRAIRNSLLGGLVLLIVFSVIVLIQRNKTKKAKKRAEESEKYKQQFLANMSHEIRTPMNAIMGMTNLVLETPLQQNQKKYLTGVQKASNNLLHIINEILDLSKIEAGKMELEQIHFSVRDVAETVQQTLKHKSDEKGIELLTQIATDVPEVLIGDPGRLNQILMNLAGNAIKFTDKGSVMIQVNKANQDKIYFAVIDTGIGIAEDKIAKIFESFSQANASDTRKYGGTGLGLTISKQFIELMGGRLNVSSVLGSGTTFSFEIALPTGSKDKMEDQNSGQQIDGSMLNGLKILLADDNEANRIVCADTIKSKSDAQITEAENGKEVLELLKNEDYDVILMDVQMPEMDGYQATRHIRNDFPEPKKNIPIIALTASVIRSDLDKCRDAGMNDYVPKPFQPVQLMVTIAKLTDREIKYKKSEPEEKTKIQQTESNEIINLNYLTSFCEGDKKKMQKYIQIFLDSAPGLISKLETALSENDFETIANQTHGFKTRLIMTGMDSAKTLALKLELACRGESPDLEAISKDTSDFIQQINQAVRELNDYKKLSLQHKTE